MDRHAYYLPLILISSASTQCPKRTVLWELEAEALGQSGVVTLRGSLASCPTLSLGLLIFRIGIKIPSHICEEAAHIKCLV